MQEIIDLLVTERAARDLGQWEEMGGTFAADSRVAVSWFRGSGAEFVAASRAMTVPSFHELGAVRVRAAGDRAVADANASVHVRVPLRGVEVDVTTHGRLYWRLRRAPEWRIVGLTMLYLKDTMVPPVDLGPTDGLRPSYRMLAAALRELGREIDPDLPGTDRPETVAALLAEHRAWLLS